MIGKEVQEQGVFKMDDADVRPDIELDAPRNGLEKVRLENVPVENVQASAVEMQNCLVRNVSTSDANLAQSGALHLKGDRIEIHQGGAGLAHANTLQLQQGGIGIAQADEIAVDGMVGLGVADSIHLTSGQAGVLLANEVRTSGSRTVLLLAGRVDGPVETVLDTPRTILAGLVSGVAVGLVLLVGNLLTRRRRR